MVIYENVFFLQVLLVFLPACLLAILTMFVAFSLSLQHCIPALPYINLA
jgi:hypothetical protein